MRHEHSSHERSRMERRMHDNEPSAFGHGDFGRGRGGHGRGHGGRGRGGRRRMLDSGELRLALLKLIGDQPRHGYDLIRAIEELTGGAYSPSPGVIYPALSMLVDMGHIEEAEAEGPRKVFSATAAGIAELSQNAEKADALFARLSALRSTSERIDQGPLKRAMENLRMALRDRIGGEAVEKSTVHQAADILDEAARRIERL